MVVDVDVSKRRGQMDKEFKKWLKKSYPNEGISTEILKMREQIANEIWAASQKSLLKKLSKILKSKRCGEANCRYCKNWPCSNKLLSDIMKEVKRG